MLTVPSSVNSPTTLSLLPSVLAVGTPDITSTRVTQSGLPAPLTGEQVADNAQGNVTIPVAAQENTIAATVSASGATGSLASNLNASGPSASFLAQVLGQSDDDENTTAATYAHFAPAPEYNTFVGYSFIKYKPSNAGIPPQRSPLPAPVANYTAPAPAPVVTTPVETAPVVAQNDKQDTVSAPVSVPVAAATTAPTTQNIPVQNGTPPVTPPAVVLAPAVAAATVTGNDFQAYSQTQSRNQSNLSLAQPQFIVAG